jgi:two-component system response regulator YesN
MRLPNTLNIMIVDDEEPIREGLKTAIKLEILNLHVISSACDGLDALAKIKLYKPHIVITDIMMPNLTGLELIREVNKLEIECDFIILSGFNEFKYAQEAIKMGAKEYLLKPIDVEELNSIVYKIATKRRKKLQLNSYIDTTDIEKLRKAALKTNLEKLIFNTSMIKVDPSFLDKYNSNLKTGVYQIILFSYHGDIEELFKTVTTSFSKKNHETWIYSNTKIISLIDSNQIKNYDKFFKFMLLNSTINTSLLAIGISDPFTDILQCSQHYNLALTAIAYQLYNNNQIVFFGSEINHLTPKLQTNNIKIDDIVELILKQDTVGISNYCNSFFHSLFFIANPPPSYTKGMCIFIIAQVQIELQKNFSNKKTQFPTINYEQINKYKNFDEIKNWVLDILINYSNLSQTAINKNSKGFIHKIDEYIENHMDQMIFNDEIANELSINEYYLSNKFKELTGINLKTYIINKKCKVAKIMLIKGSLNVSEIATKIGYNEYRSFYRAFKQKTGLTPTQFQNEYLLTKDK